MNILGKEIEKDEVLNSIGDISQIGGISSFEFNDGVSKGVRAIEIKTIAGLNMTVLLDRGMDISFLSYKSVPISFRSKVRETSPTYFESRGYEFLRTFFGGFLTTCGLTYMGPQSKNGGEEFGLHGRISNISAENVWADGEWSEKTYKIWVYGKVREAKFFGDYLQLTRKITTYMDKPEITIEDTVENIGKRKPPLMILYHLNFGYPFLNSNSKIIEGEAEVKPLNENSERDFNKYREFCKPTVGFKEQAFLHDIKPDSDGNSNIALVDSTFNDGNGLGIWLKFNKDNLPYLLEWKNASPGENVCGLEPVRTGIQDMCGNNKPCQKIWKYTCK